MPSENLDAAAASAVGAMITPEEVSASSTASLEEAAASIADGAQATASGPDESAAEETQPEAEATEEDILSLIEGYRGEAPDEEPEPDFEAEAEEELVAESPEEETYTDDPELLEERRKRLALEKKLAWLEGQKIKSESVKWAEEAGRRWPLSKPFLADIKATSHRSFNREAQKIQAKIEPWFEENYAGPLKGYLDTVREQIRAEERANAEKAWGKATPGPGTVPIESSERQARMEKARNSNDPLLATIKEFAFGGGEQ